jgi:hypothetical protein
LHACNYSTQVLFVQVQRSRMFAAAMDTNVQTPPTSDSGRTFADKAAPSARAGG